MMTRRLLAACAAFAVLFVALAPTASAHKTAYAADGAIKIVWGFLGEPAVTWSKTGLDLALTDNATGEPILGADESLEVRLKHADQELLLEGLSAQSGRPGSYTHVVTLTRPGIYSIHLRGAIDGREIDIEIEAAHAIAGIEETFFPAVDASPYAPGGADAARMAALEAKVAALEAQAKTQAQTPATVTVQTPASPVPGASVALLGLGLVAVALALRRRS